MEYSIKQIDPGPSKGFNYPVEAVKYEFFEPVTIKDELTGEEITINKKVSSHSLEELEKQKADLELALMEVNAKIDQIKSITQIK